MVKKSGIDSKGRVRRNHGLRKFAITQMIKAKMDTPPANILWDTDTLGDWIVTTTALQKRIDSLSSLRL